MAPYALNPLARYLHCTTTCIFVKVDPTPPRRSVFPFHGGKLGFLARGVHQTRIHPVGPIATITVPRVAYVEMQFLGVFEICGHLNRLTGSLGGNDLACEERLGRVLLGAFRGQERKPSQESQGKGKKRQGVSYHH